MGLSGCHTLPPHQSTWAWSQEPLVPVSGANSATKQHLCFSLGVFQLAPRLSFTPGTMSAGRGTTQMAMRKWWASADLGHPGFLSVCTCDSWGTCFSGPTVQRVTIVTEEKDLSGSQWDEMSNAPLLFSRHTVLL